MRDFYGDEIMDGPPYSFLINKGWKERSGILEAPRPLHEVSDQEFWSALFLRDEWDYDFDV